MIERPPGIKATHLALRCVIYMRQSSPDQLESHKGSTEAQRQQQELALAWGWPVELIDVVDDDLGVTGAAAEHRHAYNNMVEEIRAERVGAIFLTDFSRGGRNSIEWLILIESCRVFGTLLVVDGRVYDLADANVLFMSQLQGLLTEQDSRIRLGHLERGRRATLKAGRTVSQPPAGYVRLPGGEWIEDPDQSVREGVHAVFRAFLERHSLRGAVDRLREMGARVPRRNVGHPVHWVDATVPAVQAMIKNGVYTGDYLYGRRHSDPKLGRDRSGQIRSRKAQGAEVFVMENHHPAYVSRAEFRQIQVILEENRWNSRCSGGLGRGHALLQGLIRCRLHRSGKMSPSYKSRRKDGHASHSYHCIGEHHRGGRQCGARPGAPIDAKVVEAVMEHVSPPRIEMIREEFRKAQKDELSEGKRQRADLHRLEMEVDQLWDRYVSSSPANPRVRAELERRLEEAKTRLEELRNGTAASGSPVGVFNEATFGELISLSSDLHALWSAQTTTNRDRKEILRAVIESVSVLAFDTEKITVAIRWLDDCPETALEVMLPPHAHRLMRDWCVEGLGPVAIASRLNKAGIRTKYLTSWTSSNVERALRRMQSKGRI